MKITVTYRCTDRDDYMTDQCAGVTLNESREEFMGFPFTLANAIDGLIETTGTDADLVRKELLKLFKEQGLFAKKSQ